MEGTTHLIQFDRSSPPKVILGKAVLKTWSKFTGEHPFRSLICLKLLCNFIENALWHRCSPVNLLHIFRTTFCKNIPGGRLLTWRMLLLWHCSKLLKTIICTLFKLLTPLFIDHENNFYFQSKSTCLYMLALKKLMTDIWKLNVHWKWQKSETLSSCHLASFADRYQNEFRKVTLTKPSEWDSEKYFNWKF